MSRFTYCLTLFATTLLLAACGGKKDEATSNDTAAPSGALGQAMQQAAEAAKADAIPKADANKPLSEYTELRSGQQVMFMYVATSKLPPDFEKLAGSFSQEYRQSNDAFRKNDLLQAQKPQIEQGIAEAAASPYTWIELDDANLQAYDFERKGFPVGEFSGDRYRYFHDASGYTYTWANPTQVNFAPVADETMARTIESMRTKWNASPRLRVYSMAQSVDMNAQRVNALVTRVQIVDRNGRVLAEYAPDGTVPVVEPANNPASPADAASIAADVLGGKH